MAAGLILVVLGIFVGLWVNTKDRKRDPNLAPAPEFQYGSYLRIDEADQNRKPRRSEGLNPCNTRPKLLFGRRPCLGILPAEAFDATSGVDQLLLAGKEWVASGADFYVDIALVSRTGSEMVAARAHDAYFVVNGVNGCLHSLRNLYPER